MAVPVECPECRKLFTPDRPSRNAGCCSRHCARIREARQGEPSLEDRKARFAAEVLALVDKVLLPKDK